MNLEELGAALRAERERRGLSIEDVANSLKIGARHLRALEDADLSSLPHVAYTRGFIRAYAGFLGLSQAEFDGVLQGLAPQENIAPAQAVYMPAEESGSGVALGRLFSLLIVLIILGGGGYFLWSSGLLQKGVDMVRGTGGDAPHVAKPSGLPDPAAESPAPQSGQKSGPQPGQKSGPDRKESAPDAKASSAAPAPAPAPQAAQERPAAATTVAAQTPAPAPAPQAPAPSATAAGDARTAPAAAADGIQPEQHKVIIIATEECWIRSNADKTDVRQFSLNKGDTFALTFSHRLELKLGNAGGVRIRYDGKEMPPAGTSGQVLNLVFPPEN